MGRLFRKRAKAGPVEEGDALVLKTLRDHGADLRQPRSVRYYLYFPSQEAAEGVATALRASGYTVDVRLGGDQNDWLALASTVMVVSADAVSRDRAKMSALAADGQGKYDGWEASPKP